MTSLTLYGALASYSYGTKDLYTDADGKLRVWFPATGGAAFVAKVDKLAFKAKASLEKLETLKKAMMQKYFN